MRQKQEAPWRPAMRTERRTWEESVMWAVVGRAAAMRAVGRGLKCHAGHVRGRVRGPGVKLKWPPWDLIRRSNSPWLCNEERVSWGNLEMGDWIKVAAECWETRAVRGSMQTSWLGCNDDDNCSRRHSGVPYVHSIYGCECKVIIFTTVGVRLLLLLIWRRI